MAKSVVIYTTPTCVWCKATKEFFRENNVEYTEYNVAGDQAKAREMVQKSGQMGVPVVVITDEQGKEEVVVGFNKPRLKELLNM